MKSCQKDKQILCKGITIRGYEDWKKIPPLKKESKDLQTIIDLCGKFDSTIVTKFEEIVEHLIKQGYYCIVLDVKDVYYIDSSGIGVLIKVLKRVTEKNGYLKIRNIVPEVKKIFELTKLTKIFDFGVDSKKTISEPDTKQKLGKLIGGIERCWEAKNCQQWNCPVYGNSELICWAELKTTGQEKTCKNLIEKLEYCVNCPIFTNNINQFTYIKQELLTYIEEAEETFSTLQEKNEQLQRANQELKELDNMKSEFVSNISHELRIPLTIIKGYNELLLDGTMGKINVEQKNALKVVHKKTNHLIQLIMDIIDFQQNKELSLHFKKNPLRQIVKHTCETVMLEAKSKGVTINLNLPKTIPSVECDRMRIEQIFLNLLENAIKFTPKGGKIEIEISRWIKKNDTWKQKEGDLQKIPSFTDFPANLEEVFLVSISDTGIGIPEKEHARVFDRFYQVNGSLTRLAEGTGLGLSIVKSIVESHRGKIWLESEIGQGSTFYFILPKEQSST